jgi:hypothetical protein
MKNFFIALLMIGCPFASFAQQKDFKTEIYIGAKGGITFSKVRFNPNVDVSFQEGKLGGIMFRLISEPHIGFQVEVNYTQKGWKEDSIGYLRRLSYISMPVMTHINMGSKAFRFTINLGPEIAYQISDEEQFKSGIAPTTDQPGYRTYFGKPTDSQLDLLFTVGLGMEYHTKKGRALSLEGRAFYSLPNLFNPDLYPYQNSQSNGAQVTLAYLFQLNKKKKAEE